MWQATQGRLSTNSMRAIWTGHDEATCPFGCDRIESVLHLLRDCGRAKALWLQFLAPASVAGFFTGDLDHWFSWNCRSKPGTGLTKGEEWPRVFSFVCWSLWTSRCTYVFEGRQLSTKELKHQCTSKIMECTLNGMFHHKIYRIQEEIKDR